MNIHDIGDYSSVKTCISFFGQSWFFSLNTFPHVFLIRAASLYSHGT